MHARRLLQTGDGWYAGDCAVAVSFAVFWMNSGKEAALCHVVAGKSAAKQTKYELIHFPKLCYETVEIFGIRKYRNGFILILGRTNSHADSVIGKKLEFCLNKMLSSTVAGNADKTDDSRAQWDHNLLKHVCKECTLFRIMVLVSELHKIYPHVTDIVFFSGAGRSQGVDFLCYSCIAQISIFQLLVLQSVLLDKVDVQLW